jgi:hypothetical protein
MKRNAALRITPWRFGAAIAAVYALVLQSILLAAAPVPAGAGTIRSAGITTPLCTPSAPARSGSSIPAPAPAAPGGQHSCICLFHYLATGNMPPDSPVVFVRMSGIRQVALEGFADSRLVPGRLHERPQARAPPTAVPA